MWRKSTMRRCFYHTDLVQNAVFHSLSRQITFIQFSGPSKHAWTFNSRNRSKNFQNHLYGHPVLTFDKRQICEEILKELRFNVVKNLMSLFFIHGFITTCNLKKRLIRSAFWVLLQVTFMNGWKQTAKRWKLHFWDYQQSIKKFNSVEHLQRQQFSFTKTNEYLSVSKNPQVFTSKLKD